MTLISAPIDIFAPNALCWSLWNPIRHVNCLGDFPWLVKQKHVTTWSFPEKTDLENSSMAHNSLVIFPFLTVKNRTVTPCLFMEMNEWHGYWFNMFSWYFNLNVPKPAYFPIKWSHLYVNKNVHLAFNFITQLIKQSETILTYQIMTIVTYKLDLPNSTQKIGVFFYHG